MPMKATVATDINLNFLAHIQLPLRFGVLIHQEPKKNKKFRKFFMVAELDLHNLPDSDHYM